MDVQTVSLIAALAGLTCLSAFFSGSETALIGSSRIKLHHMAEKGSRGAQRTLDLLKKPGDLLAIILVGNTLVNTTIAALGTVLMGPVYATIVVTMVLLLFGESTPKTLAMHRSERLAAQVSILVQGVGYVLKPIVWATSRLTRVLLWPALRGKHSRERRYSRQELLSAIRIGAREGALEPAETRITREVLTLKETPVQKIMIPLADVDGIDEGVSYQEVMDEVARSGNTRYPIYRGEITDPIGLLLVKDLLVHHEGARENWRQYVRPLMRCKATLEADELLRDMQIRRSHMAAVENKAGRVVGIVTMEDVLEEIVGEILDEYDDEEGELIREFRPGHYMVQGKIEVDDLCKVLNTDLGQVGQHMTLSQWFEKVCTDECNPPKKEGRHRRLRIGSVRIRPWTRGRFEIMVKGQIPGSRPSLSPDRSLDG